jgi:hypothetical protein
MSIYMTHMFFDVSDIFYLGSGANADIEVN